MPSNEAASQTDVRISVPWRRSPSIARAMSRGRWIPAPRPVLIVRLSISRELPKSAGWAARRDTSSSPPYRRASTEAVAVQPIWRSSAPRQVSRTSASGRSIARASPVASTQVRSAVSGGCPMPRSVATDRAASKSISRNRCSITGQSCPQRSTVRHRPQRSPGVPVGDGRSGEVTPAGRARPPDPVRARPFPRLRLVTAFLPTPRHTESAFVEQKRVVDALG